MSRGWQLAIGGIVIAIILFAFGIPLWVPIVVALVALAIPVIGYRVLDPSQRRRVRRVARKQLGR